MLVLLAFPLALSASATEKGYSVYSGEYSSGWQVLQWENTVVSQVPGPRNAYRNNMRKSLRVVTSGQFGRMYLVTATSFKATDQQLLRLSVKIFSSETAENQLYLALYTPDGSPIHNVLVSDYIKDKKLSVGTWYNVTIPIAHLQAVDQLIGAVVVEAAQPAAFDVDAISFSPSQSNSKK